MPPFVTARDSQRAEAEQMIDKRRGKSATYTQPLVGSSVAEQEDIASFLSEFYLSGIFDQNKHMKRLLEQYPDTIGTHYGLLVPNVVSFDQFWSRYFYRCSTTTVLTELQRTTRDRENVQAQLSPTMTTMQTQFLKLEIERGLGSRIRIAENNAERSDPEQRAALRASILKEEIDLDITETIDEDDENGESEEDTGVGIGFSSSA